MRLADPTYRSGCTTTTPTSPSGTRRSASDHHRATPRRSTDQCVWHRLPTDTEQVGGGLEIYTAVVDDGVGTPQQFSTWLTEHGPPKLLADVMRAGRAVQRALSADKMNYLLLGNGQPHAHSHLVPRYYGDPAPGRPFLPEQPVVASEEDLLDRVERIRAAL